MSQHGRKESTENSPHTLTMGVCVLMRGYRAWSWAEAPSEVNCSLGIHLLEVQSDTMAGTCAGPKEDWLMRS